MGATSVRDDVTFLLPAAKQQEEAYHDFLSLYALRQFLLHRNNADLHPNQNKLPESAIRLGVPLLRQRVTVTKIKLMLGLQQRVRVGQGSVVGWKGGGEGGGEGGFLVAGLLLLDAGQLVVVLLRDKVGVVV